MADQTVIIEGGEGWDTTDIVLLSEYGNTIVDTVNTEDVGDNDGTLYKAIFTDVAAARYRVRLRSNGVIVAGDFVTLALATAEYPCEGLLSSGDATEANQTTIIDAIAALSASTGVGAFTIQLRIKLDSDELVPECDCVLTTSTTGPSVDIHGSARSDANAIATFDVDMGVYYLWRQKSGINFDNPLTVTVDGAGDAVVTGG